MPKTFLLLLLSLLIVSYGSNMITQGETLDLSQFRWKNRLLFIFAPDSKHPHFERLQQSLKTQREQIAERDLIIFEILESGSSVKNSESLEPSIAQTLWQKFELSRGDFAVILIGKDGGIKLNRQAQTDLKDIFGLIDSMPMCQDEIVQQNRSD